MQTLNPSSLNSPRSAFSLLTVVLLLGISSGFPLALTASGGTFQAFATDYGFSLTQLGTLVIFGLPYSLKFLWAPFFDRYACPFLSGFGFRRGWLIATQLTLAALYVALSYVIMNPPLLAVVLFGIAFASASQDIAVDAYRTEILPAEQRGSGSSFAVLGYRIGMILSGAVTLALADVVSWGSVLAVCAALQLIVIVPVIWAPSEPQTIVRPRDLKSALISPFREFWSRGHAFEVLIFVMLYKAPDALGTLFTTRFLLDCGYARTEIAAVLKGVGLASVLIGGIVAGFLMTKLSIRQSLVYFGVLQGLTVIPFILLARANGPNTELLTAVVIAENLGSGMSGTAFVAFLMALCRKELAATQFALLTSIAAFARTALGPAAGHAANALGWELYFLGAGLLNVPALLLLWGRGSKWKLGTDEKL